MLLKHLHWKEKQRSRGGYACVLFLEVFSLSLSLRFSSPSCFGTDATSRFSLGSPGMCFERQLTSALFMYIIVNKLLTIIYIKKCRTFWEGKWSSVKFTRQTC